MPRLRVDQQRHGYVGGHQLLATSTVLDPRDQNVVDRLSDIGGQPGPNESVPDYLTGYPLPSGRFFAFARTWYDYQAPRAGCVLTHTLLVPTADWSTIPSIQALTRHHAQFERERSGKQLPPVELSRGGRLPYPPTDAKGLPELCEAVFLEDRKPIVWLTEPDDGPALRLVEALWPALRSRFAFQTYALKPRSKAHGLFDLMVAPRSARSRFSGWEGRRIDGDTPPRHAFTPLLVQSIFRGPFPDLEPADPLGVLQNDQVGDPGKLRLSILWNTLQTSGSDPNTMLGMLDVLSAADLPRTSRWRLAEPLFNKILEVASSEAGRSGLMELALGKLEPGDGDQLSEPIDRSLRRLIQIDPRTATRLAGGLWRDPTLADILRQSLANALVDTSPARAWAVLRDQSVELVCDLLHRRLDLVGRLSQYESQHPADWFWFSSLLRALKSPDRDRVREGVLAHIRTGAQSVLLADLLGDATADELSRVLRHLLSSGGLRDADLIETFASLPSSTATEKLDAVSRAHLPGAVSQTLYEAILKPKPWAIDWIFRANLSSRAKAQLLIGVVERMSRSDRMAITSSDEGRLDAVVQMLLSHNSGEALAAQFLSEAPRLSEVAFAQAVDHFGDKRSEAAQALLASLIIQTSPLKTESDAGKLLALLASPTGADAARSLVRTIVDLLIPERTPNEELTYSLGLLVAVNLQGELKQDVLGNLPTVAARAAEHRVYKLLPPAYVFWAQLVGEALAAPPDIGLPAAESALAYALRRDFDVAFPLVRVSFPSVFRATFGPSKKARRKADDLTVKTLRMFLRHRWDGVEFVEMLAQAGEPEHALAAARGYSWESRHYVDDAIDRYNDRVIHQPDSQNARLGAWTEDDIDFL